jgi:hypothetical protein
VGQDYAIRRASGLWRRGEESEQWVCLFFFLNSCLRTEAYASQEVLKSRVTVQALQLRTDL